MKKSTVLKEETHPVAKHTIKKSGSSSEFCSTTTSTPTTLLTPYSSSIPTLPQCSSPFYLNTLLIFIMCEYITHVDELVGCGGLDPGGLRKQQQEEEDDVVVRRQLTTGTGKRYITRFDVAQQHRTHKPHLSFSPYPQHKKNSVPFPNKRNTCIKSPPHRHLETTHTHTHTTPSATLLLLFTAHTILMLMWWFVLTGYGIQRGGVFIDVLRVGLMCRFQVATTTMEIALSPNHHLPSPQPQITPTHEHFKWWYIKKYHTVKYFYVFQCEKKN